MVMGTKEIAKHGEGQQAFLQSGKYCFWLGVSHVDIGDTQLCYSSS